MNFLCYVFLSHLPYVEEETRFIDGKEQRCLIIPTESNQIKRGKQGNWLMILRLAEKDLNPRMQTHDIQLVYLSKKYIDEYRGNGIHDRTMRMGRVYAHDRTPSRKIDRTNRSADIMLEGAFKLSDIPKQMIFRNSENDKRYISGLTIKSLSSLSTVYTGTVCLDDIPSSMIVTNQETGKKYVNIRFKKLDLLDTYMNTHVLVITGADGSEIEIGRFKEWINTDGKQTPPSTATPEEIHNTGVNQRQTPQEIDGIKF